MEPVDFLGALRRSWRLLLVLALVGAIAAVLVPVSAAHPKKHVKRLPNPWEATAVVGSAPIGQHTVVGGGASGPQIQFYAAQTAVQLATLKAFGLKHVREANVGSYLKA